MFTCFLKVDATTLTPSDKNKMPAANELYNNLFKNYFKGLRPTFNYSKPMDVNMQFWFKQIIKLNKVEQIMTVYCWIEMVSVFFKVSRVI